MHVFIFSLNNSLRHLNDNRSSDIMIYITFSMTYIIWNGKIHSKMLLEDQINLHNAQNYISILKRQKLCYNNQLACRTTAWVTTVLNDCRKAKKHGLQEVLWIGWQWSLYYAVFIFTYEMLWPTWTNVNYDTAIKIT